MKKVRFGLYIATLLCINLSCNKNNAPQPNEEFYCKINGKAWRPNRDGDIFLKVVKSEFVDKGTGFYILAWNAKSNDRFFIKVLKKSNPLTFS